MTDRTNFVEELKNTELWDILVIGGGATGLGTALDAASRGYRTLLLEQSDFAKGTSSRSTKLVHGGVRYLAQGNIRLVLHALKERGLMLQNAPHIVKKQDFVIPCYSWLAVMKYLLGLKIYDLMSGKYSFGKSEFLSKREVINAIPGVQANGLKGGVRYFDGQFDDARFAINLMQSTVKEGGILLNYIQVTNLLKNNTGSINGVIARDLETNKLFEIQSKTVINATGVFVDDILKMDAPEREQLVRPSQGVHIVLRKSFLEGDSALMIPETSDGRVLFAVPWHDHLVVGTTDTPLDEHSLEPQALSTEIDFILSTAGKYLEGKPQKEDILSVFAGLRPLAALHKNTNDTKEIPRDHKLMVSESGLLTITGGKWTTYRQMAEETINKAIQVGKLKSADCLTKNLKIFGYSKEIAKGNQLDVYGSAKKDIQALALEKSEMQELLNSNFLYIQAEVIWAVRNEMARTIEDILARRLRILFLDASEAIVMAPKVAALMAKELNYDKNWERDQVEKFKLLASNYLPSLCENANQ